MEPTLISHEIPKQLFPYHHFINSYPYLLCHLLDEQGSHYDKEYSEFYKQIVKEYSYSILDNSAFELGDSYDKQRLFEIGQVYKPSHLILPDALHNQELTKQRATEYISQFGAESIPKFMGVIQGNSLKEFRELYDFYLTVPQIEVVAIPFDLYTEEEYRKGISGKSIDYRLHRVVALRRLIFEIGVNNIKKPFHLLGCATPHEFTLYPVNIREVIKSVDTSAPIVYGWNKIPFDETGVALDVVKPKEKLADNLDIKLTPEQLQVIGHNIRQFRTNLFNK